MLPMEPDSPSPLTLCTHEALLVDTLSYSQLGIETVQANLLANEFALIGFNIK